MLASIEKILVIDLKSAS